MTPCPALLLEETLRVGTNSSGRDHRVSFVRIGRTALSDQGPAQSPPDLDRNATVASAVLLDGVGEKLSQLSDLLCFP